MVCGRGGALKRLLVGKAPLLKLGGKDNRFDDGEVRNGSDWRRFYHVTLC